MNLQIPHEGVLLVDKPTGKTSFSLVACLRKLTGVQKIGHTGTLDPLATGLMILLIGKAYTKRANEFEHDEKEYLATVVLGSSTDSYDAEGKITKTSDLIPLEDTVTNALSHFQGKCQQIPPMFSAKKVQGQKLYNLARQGKEIPRAPQLVDIQTEMLEYAYPYLRLRVVCSKGTYVRSIANDLGEMLGCGAHLGDLRRLRCGKFHIDQAISGAMLFTQLP